MYERIPYNFKQFCFHVLVLCNKENNCLAEVIIYVAKRLKFVVKQSINPNKPAIGRHHSAHSLNRRWYRRPPVEIFR